MAKKPENTGRQWTREHDKALRDYAGENTPTRLIAMKLGRTERAVRSRARDLRISLKPTNQSPYGKRKR